MAITANSGEYKSTIGLDDLYIAEVTADTTSTYTADTPETFAPAAEASYEPSTSMETQYADDQPYDVMSSVGETKISIKVTGLPIEMLAKITGCEFDATTGRMYDNGAEPPYCALSFKALKSNGSYRYYQFLKGKFDVPKEALATKGESPEPKLMELTYTAIRTTYEFDLGSINGTCMKVVGDEDTTNFDGSTWFGAVQTPAATSYSALALSSSTPTDAATGVSVSANQSLTFNNALNSDALTNVLLVKASDGSTVTQTTGYPAINTARTVITLNPASNLTAATPYIIFYAVKDVYGQTLAGAVNFTTA
jgi:phi13 family phage major tail protein